MKKPILAAVAMIAVTHSANALDFQSPSGNIHCIMEGNHVRCDIINHTPSYAAPSSCDGDFGQAFGVSARGHGKALCVTDSTMNYSGRDVLQYGQTIEGDGVSCQSRKDGMRCINEGGGGFHISRNKQRVF